MTGFEPATSCSQSKRATKLRHIPWTPFRSGYQTIRCGVHRLVRDGCLDRQSQSARCLLSVAVSPRTLDGPYRLTSRAHGGIRTRVILGGNQTLYQLSYIRMSLARAKPLVLDHRGGSSFGDYAASRRSLFRTALSDTPSDRPTARYELLESISRNKSFDGHSIFVP